jgi:hypothetical protein
MGEPPGTNRATVHLQPLRQDWGGTVTEVLPLLLALALTLACAVFVAAEFFRPTIERSEAVTSTAQRLGDPRQYVLVDRPASRGLGCAVL